VAAEVAAAQHISHAMASGQMYLALALRDRLPQVAALFAEGAMSARLASAMVWHTEPIQDPDTLKLVDARLAQDAARFGPLSVTKMAAQLAGVDVNDETGSVVSLCVDTTNAAKRDVWSAWDVRDARTGHWGALAATGARIRAATLESIAPYPRPAPLEHRLVPTGMVGVYEERVFDTEAPDYEPPDEPNRALIPGRRMVSR
jgi:hypothetical protein